MIGSAWQGPAVEVPRPPARPRVVQPLPPDPAAAHFSIVIGRRPGAVLVSVHGELDLARAEQLGTILADLIDGQGNLSLVIDLHGATASHPDSLLVFTEAAERARLRGGMVRIKEPAGPLGDAIQLRGLDRFAAEG